MGRAPKDAECAEGGIEECAANVAAKLVFIEWTTVASGPGRAACCVELVRKKVIAAVDDYLERCADVKVDIEALERLMESEEVEVCLRYILKYSTRTHSNIFQLFDTKKKNISWQAEGVGWSTKEGG